MTVGPDDDAAALTPSQPPGIVPAIASFAAIFAGLGLAETQAGYPGAAVLVAGVFTGSTAWWLALIGAVGLIRERITSALLAGVNRATGVIVVLFGLAVLARAVL